MSNYTEYTLTTSVPPSDHEVIVRACLYVDRAINSIPSKCKNRSDVPLWASEATPVLGTSDIIFVVERALTDEQKSFVCDYLMDTFVGNVTFG